MTSMSVVRSIRRRATSNARIASKVYVMTDSKEGNH